MVAKIFFTAKNSMYAGSSFEARTPTNPSSASQKMSPDNETPCCFRMNPPLKPRLLFLFDAVADALEVTEVHPHQEGAPLDVVVGDESPVTAVAALVAVVSHHEVLSLRDR